MEKLKECPFCGCEAQLEEISLEVLGDNVSFAPGCVDSECVAHQVFARFARRSDAVKAWNKRK